MTTTEKVYKKLIAGIVSCNTIEQIKSVIKQVLNIDENHLMFEDLVRKLCDRNGINYYQDSIIDIIEKYLHTLEGTLGIRKFIEKVNLEMLAKLIVEKYNVMQSLTMAQFKRIAQSCGYIVGPTFKSTKKLTNLIESNM